MSALSGKSVVLCVTGGIAAYKAADIISKLRKKGADVFVIMTKSATEFITPLTLEVLSGNRVVVDMFSRDFTWEVEHISLAKRADVFVIAPATANVIGKAAHGIADDMVTTTLMATKAPMVNTQNIDFSSASPSVMLLLVASDNTNIPNNVPPNRKKPTIMTGVTGVFQEATPGSI